MTPRTPVAAAARLHKKANRPNLFIKIPGTKEGNVAIEEAIAAGVAINVTLLFSREHYLASADAYMRGLERRIAAGLNPDVRSVASVFLSRWDGATMEKVPDPARGTSLALPLGSRYTKPTAMSWTRTGWQRLANSGARPQRLLFASTGKLKDPKASDVLYISGLAAPNTINTMPEKTLLAFGDHGELARDSPARRRKLRDCSRRFPKGWNQSGTAGNRPTVKRRHVLR